MINETIASITNISSCNHFYAAPAIIFQFIILMLIMLSGAIFVNNKTKYLTIWAFVFILGGIITAALIFLPNSFHAFFDFVKNFFKF